MIKSFTKGIIKENPVFVLLLGLCPTLGVTTSFFNAIGMGLGVIFVLLGSNIVISLLKKVIPDEVRIPSYIVIIATFVTVVELVLHAYVPALYDSLGIFIPLIVVNCIVLGRAEAFASKNSIFLSILDALGMGLGFTFALMIIAIFREVLGSGTLTLWVSNSSTIKFIIPGLSVAPIGVIAMPAGAMIVVGLIIGGINWLKMRKSSGGVK